jgi:glycosyltransferase involved in cell wall biosynthesis
MPQQIAGTEVYTYALAKSLLQKNYTVTVVVPNYEQQNGDEYTYEGITVKRYPEPNLIDRALRLGKRAPDGIDAFEKLIQNIHPDVVHVQEMAGSSGVGIYHLRVLKKLRISTLLTMHLANYSCFSSTLMYKGTESCNGLIDVARCSRCAISNLPVSPALQSLFVNASIPLFNFKINTSSFNNKFGTALSYPFIIAGLNERLKEVTGLCDKVIVLTDWYRQVLISNKVKEDKIELVKQALPVSAEVKVLKTKEASAKLKLIFIGRIDALKGVHLLVDAVKELPGDKIAVDIYGSTPDTSFYRELKAKTASINNIKWKGSIAQNKVVETIAEYDALVLPSTFSEMSPLVIQEAFAAGVPVIGANVAGIAEQVKDRINGRLFKFNSSASLKELLAEVLQHPQDFKNLSAGILPPASFEEVSTTMISIYNKVVGSKV